MLFKSVSRRVSTNCFTLIDRKIPSRCLLILSLFSLCFLNPSLAQDKLIEESREQKSVTFYKEKKGSEIINLLARNLTALSFKELVILSEAYKWDENNLKRAQVLEYTKNRFPKKVSVQLELGNTYLAEAMSYAKTTNFKTIRNKNIEKAREIFMNVVKESPSLASYKSYISFLEETPNSPDELIQVITQGKNNIGESPYFLTKLCKWHYEAGYINQGLKSCRKAVEIKSNDSESHLNLAKLLSDSGKKDQARESMIKTANRFPASSNAQFLAATIFHKEGKIVESLKHLDAAVKNDPPDEALVLRAKLLFSLNKLDESLKAYTDACKKHKEPRKPLLKSLKKAFVSIDEKDPLKSSYESTLYKCKYVYRPERKTPKGFVSSKK